MIGTLSAQKEKKTETKNNVLDARKEKKTSLMTAFTVDGSAIEA
jgi:hypothetical protein